jgi:hypothetical protein
LPSAPTATERSLSFAYFQPEGGLIVAPCAPIPSAMASVAVQFSLSASHFGGGGGGGGGAGGVVATGGGTTAGFGWQAGKTTAASNAQTPK